VSLKSLTPDTNVLVRVIVRDDLRQAREAERILRDASVIALAIPCLCEVVWVLRSGYRLTPDQVGQAVRTLLDASNVEVNRPAAEAGLAVLRPAVILRVVSSPTKVAGWGVKSLCRSTARRLPGSARKEFRPACFENRVTVSATASDVQLPFSFPDLRGQTCCPPPALR